MGDKGKKELSYRRVGLACRITLHLFLFTVHTHTNTVSNNKIIGPIIVFPIPPN